jgi:hypothetical protein
MPGTEQLKIEVEWKPFQLNPPHAARGNERRSFVRRQMLSELKPRYAGYVAWRGVVPESEVDRALLHTFDDHFTFQQTNNQPKTTR